MKHIIPYNEAIRDFLKPKSEEEIKGKLESLPIGERIDKIVRYKLYSDKQIKELLDSLPITELKSVFKKPYSNYNMISKYISTEKMQEVYPFITDAYETIKKSPFWKIKGLRDWGALHYAEDSRLGKVNYYGHESYFEINISNSKIEDHVTIKIVERIDDEKYITFSRHASGMKYVKDIEELFNVLSSDTRVPEPVRKYFKLENLAIHHNINKIEKFMKDKRRELEEYDRRKNMFDLDESVKDYHVVESIKDYLKPKSKEDIIKHLEELPTFDKIYKLMQCNDDWCQEMLNDVIGNYIEIDKNQYDDLTVKFVWNRIDDIVNLINKKIFKHGHFTQVNTDYVLSVYKYPTNRKEWDIKKVKSVYVVKKIDTYFDGGGYNSRTIGYYIVYDIHKLIDLINGYDINESVKGFLKPVSQEKLKKLLDDIVFPSDRLLRIIKYKLFNIFTKEELLKLFERSSIDSKRDIINNFSSLTHFTKSWKDKPLTAGVIYGMNDVECEDFFKNVMLKKFYKNNINESIKDFLKPKSTEDIKKFITKLSGKELYFKLFDIGRSNLMDFFSKTEYEELLSKLSKWDRGYLNTKLFEYQSIFGKSYLQGCRHCDKIVPLNYTEDRQQIGNASQTLCKCAECGEYIIFDDNKSRALEIYLSKNNI